jgi:PIN domain nuclease of toxin-antitoxin system
MRVLLDTHTLLAIIEQQLDRFTPGIRSLLADSTGEFHVSVASLWEIAIKWRLGKLQLTPGLKTLPRLLTSMGIELISINEHHTLIAVEPEPLTRDPLTGFCLRNVRSKACALLRLIARLSTIQWRSKPSVALEQSGVLGRGFQVLLRARTNLLDDQTGRQRTELGAIG